MASLKTNERRVDKPIIPAPVATTSDQANPSSDHDPVISTKVVVKKRKNNNKRKRHIIGLAPVFHSTLYQANVFCT